ncbi:MAG TPA: type II toxin-antitoxin system prevent-host-death family antitoxin [Vicinamibacterales bacterium]|nr:type II toxin-antitoxin system prevent-host-death family antitoxin [Vicinamibacterales bacterium]
MKTRTKEVSVGHLKVHLTQHLRRVRAGARLTITDRGRPIATLAPVDAGDVMVAARRANWSGRRIPSRGRPASEMCSKIGADAAFRRQHVPVGQPFMG